MAAITRLHAVAVRPIAYVACRPSHLTAPLRSQRRHVVAPSMFDGLKNMLGGSGPQKGSAPKQPQPVAEQQEDDEEVNTMRRIEEGEQLGVDGSETAFGPPAVLMIGFTLDEVNDLQGMMESMGADMFKIIPATQAMMDGPLGTALSASAVDYEQPKLGQRRAIVLSGMYGGEVVEVVAAYRESGMPEAVFCVAVPNNINRQVKDLVSEVMAEDAAMKKMAQERAAQQGGSQ